MPSCRATPRFRRLSRYDLHCLAVETPARPIQLGVLAVLDGRTLCDPAGRLRLADIRREIERRLAGVPELRRVVFRPGAMAGRPLWLDDPAFRIEWHVDEVKLPPRCWRSPNGSWPRSWIAPGRCGACGS
jgi:diacylglycerol O-acyltransferase